MRVKLRITSATDDYLRFKGEVSIAGVNTYFCDLFFILPIEECGSALWSEDTHELREVTRLALSRDNVHIELNDAEYRVFYGLVMDVAWEIYKKSIGRCEHCNARGIGARIAGEIELEPEDCKILSSQKFNCQLLTPEVPKGIRPN